MRSELRETDVLVIPCSGIGKVRLRNDAGGAGSIVAVPNYSHLAAPRCFL